MSMLNSPTGLRDQSSMASGSLFQLAMTRPDSASSVHSTTSESACSSGEGRGPKRGQDICISEEVKIAIDLALERYKQASPEEYHELSFPSSLTATERAYIHRLAASLNLKSKSQGSKHNRHITVSRQNVTNDVTTVLKLSGSSCHHMTDLLQRFPVTAKEKHDLTPRVDRNQSCPGVGELAKTMTGKLNNGLPQVPTPRMRPSEETLQLPIQSEKHRIVRTISQNQVVMISGETGCGKTTQVPQMILDDCCESHLPCRIICTQPRRIAAISMAERVAYERGENVGHSVGYQIRLESRVSPKTLLTFCTNGVLLRTLVCGGSNVLNTVTHVIVDEVHERDRLCDFMLIVLRQAAFRCRNLKLILMSATVNTEVFQSYFGNCPIVTVPGSLYNVQEYYLEDALKLTGYTTKEMDECKRKLKQANVANAASGDKASGERVGGDGLLNSDARLSGSNPVTSLEDELQNTNLESEQAAADIDVIHAMDNVLEQLVNDADEDLFNQVFYYVMSEDVSADYQHSKNGMTPLMVAVTRGLTIQAEQLINLGANVNVRSLQTHQTALDIARENNKTECIDLLLSYSSSDDANVFEEDESLNLSADDLLTLEAYHHSFDDEKVNYSLISTIIKWLLNTTDSSEAILVFLPGYDDIISQRDSIVYDNSGAFNLNDLHLIMLHSNIQTTDQHKVFSRPPSGVRKLVLSTNIAETSITIDDVVYVIDAGKVKERSFDAFASISTLKSNWISKSSATQRSGRAGRCRPGVAYHLFSSARYRNLASYQVAEILRTPLQELCLQTKLLAPAGTSISDFLSQAPQPPSQLIVKNAVSLLKKMDALDDFEDLTELGSHLVNLPIEPRLGKMILTALVLKCLDPVLTITCALAYKDPFVLPTHPSMKRTAAKARWRFSADSFSDHMAFLRVFQAWQKSRLDGHERSFCQKNFVSSATMEMILGLRSLILGQLRASGFVRSRGNGDIRDINTNSENWAVVKAALCAGSYPNMLRVDRNKLELANQRESKIRFHQTSAMSSAFSKISSATYKDKVKSLPTDWLIYEELCRSSGSLTNRMFASASAKCVTAVTPITVAVFAGPYRSSFDLKNESRVVYSSGSDAAEPAVNSSDSESESPDAGGITLPIDNWIKFKADPQTAKLVYHLKQKWNHLILKKLSSPSKQLSQTDDMVLRFLVNVLSTEEHVCGLKQPVGIGQRPQPMSNVNYNDFSDNYDVVSDDSSSSSERQWPRGQRAQSFDTRERRGRSTHFDNHSDTSSMRSSAPSSRQSSVASSPCNSPGPAASFLKVTNSSRYFMVKLANLQLGELFYSRSIWAADRQCSRIISSALQESQNVFVICTVAGSKMFYGVASVNRPAPKETLADIFEPSQYMPYYVNWLKRGNLPFETTQDLCNVWDNGKPIYKSRDGQEIEPSAAEALLKLWNTSYPMPRGDNSRITILQRKS